MDESVATSSAADEFLINYEILDYDYIGTGGFIIECGDESEVIGVTKKQADLVTSNCPFFQKCLQRGSDGDDGDGDIGRHGSMTMRESKTRIVRKCLHRGSEECDDDSHAGSGIHGSLVMREAQTRIIRKPDWSVAIVRHFIEVMTKGKTTLPDLGLVKGILAAGDQSLVDLRLSSLVNYLDPCSRDNDFTRLVDPSFFRFRFEAVVSSEQWSALLDRGILLFREKTNFIVQLFQERNFDRERSLSRSRLDNQRSEFLVHSEQSIQAISEIQRCLSSDSDCTKSGDETFSIYFETTESIPKEHHQLINRLAGGEGYIRTCADAVEHQTEGYTVRASLDVLGRAIEPIDEERVIHCSFRVDNPNPDTLGRFINACQRAKDYPGTLGLDTSINRYFCRKSMKDICIVLDYMRDYSTVSRVFDEFRLFSMTSESHSF